VGLVGSNGPATACAGERNATTDLAGAFCFTLERRAHGVVRLSFEGNAYLQPTTRDVSLEEPPKVELQLSTDNATWSLVDPLQLIHLQLRSTPGERQRVHLRVLRPDAPPILLDDPPSLAAGLALDVELPSSQLGEPGAVELHASIGDDADHPVAHGSVQLLLTAPVTLRWTNELTAVRPELGFETSITATALGRPVTSGWIETRERGKVSGSAPVSMGQATVTNRFLAAGQHSVPFAARYVSAHPWLLAGPALEAELAISRPSAWVHLPWLVIGLGAAGWIFRGWWRPVRKNLVTQAAEQLLTPKPGLSAHQAGGPDAGYAGRVRDVHTGEVVAGALVRVLLPSVSAEALVTETLTDIEGRFNLGRLPALPEGTRFEVSSAEHSRLRLAPPAPGQLEIHIVSRRRSLLQRLTEWARERRWPDPTALTPAEVAARARRQSEPEVERWALDIQDAVFSNSPLDEHQEHALRGRAPGLTPPAPVKR
jgi:hypothetical protein